MSNTSRNQMLQNSKGLTQAVKNGLVRIDSLAAGSIRAKSELRRPKEPLQTQAPSLQQGRVTFKRIKISSPKHSHRSRSKVSRPSPLNTVSNREQRETSKELLSLGGGRFNKEFSGRTPTVDDPEIKRLCSKFRHGINNKPDLVTVQRKKDPMGRDLPLPNLNLGLTSSVKFIQEVENQLQRKQSFSSID